MRTTTDNGIEYAITLTDEANEHFVELMINDAMNSYCNWKTAKAEHSGLGRVPLAKMEARNKGAYQAACRCIALLAEQPTSYVERYVSSLAKEEFGI